MRGIPNAAIRIRSSWSTSTPNGTEGATPVGLSPVAAHLETKVGFASP